MYVSMKLIVEIVVDECIVVNTGSGRRCCAVVCGVRDVDYL